MFVNCICKLSFIFHLLYGHSYGVDVFVSVDSNITLDCPIQSTNPPVSWYGPPDLRIYSDGIYVGRGLHSVSISGRRNIGEYNLEHHNLTEESVGFYRCSALVDGEEQHADFKLVQKRPPMDLHIVNKSGNGYIKGIEGNNMSLECIVNNGVPPVSITWKQDDSIVSTGTGDSLYLTLMPSRSDNLVILTCSTEGSVLVDTVQLDIKYMPKVEIVGGNNITTIEGNTLQIYCKVDSNPEAEHITWRDQSNTIIYRGTTLVLRLINRRESGVYKCHASNEIGTDYSHVFVSVQYPPEVYIEKNSSGNSYILKCKASGLPRNYKYLGWKHFSEKGQYIREMYGQNKNTSLSLYDNYQNIGKYVCLVSNGIPDINGNTIVNATMMLKYKRVPRFVEGNERIQYAMLNKPSEISLEVNSYPPLTNSMVSTDNGTRNTATIRSGALIFDTFYGSRIELEGFEVSYQLPQLEITDFKKYIFSVTNEVGRNCYTVELRTAEPPLMPTNVTITSLKNGFILDWISGFNGGFEQQFYIQYRVTRSDVWSTVGAINDTITNTFSIDGLIPSHMYEIRLFSLNKYDRSNMADTFKVYTLSNNESFNLWLFILPGGGILMVIVLVIVVLSFCRYSCFLKKLKVSPQIEHVEEENYNHIYEEIEVESENPFPTLRKVLPETAGQARCVPKPTKCKISYDDSASAPSRQSDSESENRTSIAEVKGNPYDPLVTNQIDTNKYDYVDMPNSTSYAECEKTYTTEYDVDPCDIKDTCEIDPDYLTVVN